MKEAQTEIEGHLILMPNQKSLSLILLSLLDTGMRFLERDSLLLAVLHYRTLPSA